MEIVNEYKLYTKLELRRIIKKHNDWLMNKKDNQGNKVGERANLSSANLSGAKNIPFIRLSCPECGSFIAWKKLSGGKIAKLLIPEEAKRSSATSNKCRASEAVVLSIENSDGTPCESGFSQYEKNFRYEVGKHVKVDDFDNNRWEECATGIHFFINKQEAIEYN